MRFLFKKRYFDKTFMLNNDTFIYKYCSSCDYSNIYDDGYVVQGFTISRDYCIISAYSRIKLNSRIYLYEKNGTFNKYVELDNSSHVGGITYDYINDIVYVTGSFGKINAYDYVELISGNVVRYKCDINISKVLDGVVSAATVYFYNNSLYVCNCSDVGMMVKFDISVSKLNKTISVKNFTRFGNLPACIQGLCVFERDSKIYYLFSQSYGLLKSIIKLFDHEFNFLGQKVLSFIGLEGIDLDYSGNIYSVFENGIVSFKKTHLSELNQSVRILLEKKYILKGKFHQSMLEKSSKTE